jgi:hypothetical protein
MATCQEFAIFILRQIRIVLLREVVATAESLFATFCLLQIFGMVTND